jgi:hypothetical protein
MLKGLLLLSFMLIALHFFGASELVPKDSSRTRWRDTVTVFPKFENKYYADYSNNLDLFLYGKRKYNIYQIVHPVNDQVLEYSPNQQLNLGFGFHYKWLGIGIAMNFGFVNHDDELYGKTKRLDWQTNVYSQKAVFDFYLQYYSNFYVVNPGDIFPKWQEGDQNYIRPDMYSITFGLGGMYILNHERFSYRAAFLQTAVQKKSAGSYMLGGDIFIQGIAADSSIFPAGSSFDTLPAVVSHSAIYFGFTNAYAYNFIFFKNYFVSLSLAAIVQIGKTGSKFEDGTGTGNYKPILHLQPRFAMGYNSHKWYAGLSFVRDIYMEIGDTQKGQMTYAFESGNFRFYMGMRFGWLTKKTLLRTKNKEIL